MWLGRNVTEPPNIAYRLSHPTLGAPALDPQEPDADVGPEARSTVELDLPHRHRRIQKRRHLSFEVSEHRPNKLRGEALQSYAAY